MIAQTANRAFEFQAEAPRRASLNRLSLTDTTLTILLHTGLHLHAPLGPKHPGHLFASNLPADQETRGPPGLSSPHTELGIHTRKASPRLLPLCSMSCSSKLPKPLEPPRLSEAPHPLLWQLQLQPSPQDAVPDATSEQRKRERKCHLVNDKLFQSHSSDPKCPGQRTAPASSLWLGGKPTQHIWGTDPPTAGPLLTFHI